MRLLTIEREPTFEELKDIIFHRAKDEMEGYLQAREKWGEKMAEVQRQRYVSLFNVIAAANLEKEFQKYKVGH